jgi:hypothetical protein
VATRRFVREYPDTWDRWRVFDFVTHCKRVGNIPKDHKLKVKHNKRRGTYTLTFTWKDW